jgi:hypothetical protein
MSSANAYLTAPIYQPQSMAALARALLWPAPANARLQCGAALDATIALLKLWYSHGIARVQPSAWVATWREEWDVFQATSMQSFQCLGKKTQGKAESTAIAPTLSTLHLHACLSTDGPAMSIPSLSEFPNTHRCSVPYQPSSHWGVVSTSQRPSTPRIAAQ